MRRFRRLRHPIDAYFIWLKWHRFPKVGENITYHDAGPYRVLATDDYGDVMLDTGEWVSWRHCCGSLRNKRRAYDPRPEGLDD